MYNGSETVKREIYYLCWFGLANAVYFGPTHASIGYVVKPVTRDLVLPFTEEVISYTRSGVVGAIVDADNTSD